MRTALRRLQVLVTAQIRVPPYVYYCPLGYSQTMEKLRASRCIDFHEPDQGTGIVTVGLRGLREASLQILPGDVSTVILVVEPLDFDAACNLIRTNELLRGTGGGGCTIIWGKGNIRSRPPSLCVWSRLMLYPRAYEYPRCVEMPLTRIDAR